MEHSAARQAADDRLDQSIRSIDQSVQLLPQAFEHTALGFDDGVEG